MSEKSGSVSRSDSENMSPELVKADEALEYLSYSASIPKAREEIDDARLNISNQDALLDDPKNRIFGIFDGVGSAPRSEEASRIASDTIRSLLENIPSDCTLKQAVDIVRQSIIIANKAVCDISSSTTATVAYIWKGPEGERKLIIGNVGDSRAYVMRDNRLTQITIDDSSLRDPDDSKARVIQDKISELEQPEKEADLLLRALFNQRNVISSALGFKETISPKVWDVSLWPNDRVFLCSDGISDNLTKLEIQNILAHTPNSDDAIGRLLIASLQRSKSSHPRSKPDDMTCISIKTQVGADEKAAEIDKTVGSIADAETFDQLYNLLTTNWDTLEFKKVDELETVLAAIDRVRKNELGFEYITRTNGLRNKVMELMERKI